MKVAFVGAGAVGQTYAYFAQKGGASTAFLVKPRHVPNLPARLPQYLLNESSGRKAPVWLANDTMLTSNQELADWNPDVVFLCTSSDALRLPWTEELIAALSSSTTIVTLAAGVGDAARIRGFAGADRTIVGLIALIAYPAPLPGETVPESGNAIWFPPLSACPFDGPGDRLTPVLDVLRRGGMPVTQKRDLEGGTGWPNAILMPFLVGLEAENWSFDKFFAGGTPGTVADAIDETCGVVALTAPGRRPFFSRLISPLSLKLILRVGQRVIPLDLETYLRVHFTKVGAQTRMFIGEYIEAAEKAGLPSSALTSLTRQLADS
jgi:2-dehydropantoate 2-reductase